MPDNQPSETHLVTYEHPPVAEVVCGVHFAPVEGFSAAHFGRFWDRLEGFGTARDVPVLVTPVEETNTLSLLMDQHRSRVWLMSDAGTEVVQLQQDRFLCNWRRTNENKYPRYERIITRFYQYLNQFEEFVRETTQGEIEATQFELSYINHVPQSPETWTSLADLGRLFRDVQWADGDRFLPTPATVDFRRVFELPKQAGKLSARLQSATLRDSGSEVLILDLTARGSLSDMASWFELAHEWIVLGFGDLTQPSAQKTVWGKHE